MNCPVCENGKSELAFLKNGYRILHCSDCGHLFTDLELDPDKVDDIYSDAYFFGGGDGYPDYTLEKDMLIQRGEYYADKIKTVMVPGKVLDIGSAAGFLLKGFENKGWQGTGIEPNKSMADYGKNIVGVNIINGKIETVELDEQFDLVVMIQVMAHLYNLNDSISTICTNLKPGGYILIETWNKDSKLAKIFGKNWHEFSPPSTLNYFSNKSLKLLMSRFSLSLIAGGRPKKSILSRHAKSLIRGKLQKTNGLKWIAGITSLIPDNIMLPYPSEDLSWHLFKKSN